MKSFSTTCQARRLVEVGPAMFGRVSATRPEHHEEDDQCTSIARLALNFKGVPYKTEWVPYIRLQETIKSLYVLTIPESANAKKSSAA